MRIFSFFHSLVIGSRQGDEKIDFCIFGLGNPGNQYYFNRHNIGFRVIDSFKNNFKKRKEYSHGNSEIVIGTLPDNLNIAAVKPLTFMNKSGIAIEEVLRRYNLDNHKFIVITDDFNLPLGTIRIRKSGSHGGHNGLKSVISCIGSDFPRLRIGVGPLPDRVPIIDFVLGNFSDAEEKIITSIILKVNDALKTFTVQNIDTVMNKYN